MGRDILEIKKRAEAFKSSFTFTYIKEIVSGRENWYNGFIVNIHDDLLVFFDIVMKKEFVVLLKDLIVVEPSKKNMPFKTAWKIYNECSKNI